MPIKAEIRPGRPAPTIGPGTAKGWIWPDGAVEVTSVPLSMNPTIAEPGGKFEPPVKLKKSGAVSAL